MQITTEERTWSITGLTDDDIRALARVLRERPADTDIDTTPSMRASLHYLGKHVGRAEALILS